MQVTDKLKEVVNNIGIEYLFDDNLIDYKSFDIFKQANKQITINIEEYGYNSRRSKFQQIPTHCYCYPNK